MMEDDDDTDSDSEMNAFLKERSKNDTLEERKKVLRFIQVISSNSNGVRFMLLTRKESFQITRTLKLLHRRSDGRLTKRFEETASLSSAVLGARE